MSLQGERVLDSQFLSCLGDTHSKPGAVPSLLLASSHPSCQGNVHRGGMAEQESGREKCQSRNSWPSPQCKGDVATSPSDRARLRTVEKGNETLSVSSGELPAETLGRKGHRQRVLWAQRRASQKDSFGTVWPLWLPDPPGQLHRLSQVQGLGRWRAGLGGQGTAYESPAAC